MGQQHSAQSQQQYSVRVEFFTLQRLREKNAIVKRLKDQGANSKKGAPIYYPEHYKCDCSGELFFPGTVQSVTIADLLSLLILSDDEASGKQQMPVPTSPDAQHLLEILKKADTRELRQSYQQQQYQYQQQTLFTGALSPQNDENDDLTKLREFYFINVKKFEVIVKKNGEDQTAGLGEKVPAADFASYFLDLTRVTPVIEIVYEKHTLQEVLVRKTKNFLLNSNRRMKAWVANIVRWVARRLQGFFSGFLLKRGFQSLVGFLPFGGVAWTVGELAVDGAKHVYKQQFK